jgi:flavin-dependent dehydrogenase
LKPSHDVIVVGAGPAGATLAYELAMRGIGVLLLEQEKLPRYKCCAGGVTSKTAKLLDFDISEVTGDIIHEVSFTFNLDSPYLGQHSQALMYSVTRDVFDHFLVKKAQGPGAVLMDGQKVTHVQVSGDCVEISTANNVFRSRLVVGADGANSIVARELGMGRSIEYLMGIESEIVVPEEELAKWTSRVQIDLGVHSWGLCLGLPQA